MLDTLELTQKENALILEEQLEKGLLPYAMLFAGPRYTGRMHAALCVAEALGCSLGDMLIISSREQKMLVESAINNFEKARNNASRDILQRTLSVLLLQYNGAMAQCASASEKANFALACDISDSLKALKMIHEDEVPAFCKTLRASCQKVLANCRKTGGVSIAQARLIGKWASDTTASGKPRLIIIEGIEDANDAAKNALLKTLEEPPENTYFIMISSKAERIMPTILSRLRRYSFKALDEQMTRSLLSSVMRVDPTGYSSLEEFFLASSNINLKALKDCAASIIQGRDEGIRQACDEMARCDMTSWFYEMLSREAQEAFRSGKIKYDKARRMQEAINRLCKSALVYNQSASLTLTALSYEIRGMLNN